MLKSRTALVWGLTALAILPASARAQGNPIELGMDASLNFQLSQDAGKSTSLFLPTGPLAGGLVTGANKSFRVGFFVSPTISIEPAVSLMWFKPNGGSATRLVGLGLGSLIHFSGDSDRAQVYVRPYVGLDHAKSGDAESVERFSAGGGIGVKVPVANRLKLRLEGAFVHGFSNDTKGVASENVVALMFGFSYYTK